MAKPPSPEIQAQLKEATRKRAAGTADAGQQAAVPVAPPPAADC